MNKEVCGAVPLLIPHYRHVREGSISEVRPVLKILFNPNIFKPFKSGSSKHSNTTEGWECQKR